LGNARIVYEQLLIASLIAAMTIGIGVHREPTWIDAPELIDLLEQGAALVDTRPSFISGSKTLPGAIVIPARHLEERIDEVPMDRPVIVFGTAGGDSREPYELLKRRGYDVYDLGPMNRFPRSTHRHEHDHAHGR